MIKNKRILANYLLYQGKIYKNTIFEIGEIGDIILFPIEQEIASTVFISGIVIVSKENLLEEQYREICEMFKSEQDIKLKAKEIDSYLTKNHLYTIKNSTFVILYYDAGRIRIID